MLGVCWTCVEECVDNREGYSVCVLNHVWTTVTGHRSEQSPALEVKQCLDLGKANTYRLISANKPSPGLYPLPAKPHSVFAKPWVVNSPNLLYVILASASRTFTSRGTNSGVFPAAQRMFATDCVLNIWPISKRKCQFICWAMYGQTVTSVRDKTVCVGFGKRATRTFGDSRHARTTSAFKTSLTPGFITAFPVEIAQTMLDSSMDLKPFA